MGDHKEIREDWCNGYLPELLDQGLNCVPKPPKDFGDMKVNLIYGYQKWTLIKKILLAFCTR